MSRHCWTPWEEASLRRMYPDYSAAEIALVLGLTEAKVHNKAKKLGLKKSKDWIAERARVRSGQPWHGGTATRFRPGQKSWNKGMKGLQIGGKHSRFKPGQRPHTYRPIGSYSIRDGVLWMKVSEGAGDHSRFDWVAVHRRLWEQHHGPIPPGHCVTFKPGLHTTQADEITLDRLELITRAELQGRNSMYRYPPEVVALMKLRGALNRKINRIAKERP